ncbi:MAG: hypothetical protein U0325_03770 [Polyangiales bacterium]
MGPHPRALAPLVVAVLGCAPGVIDDGPADGGAAPRRDVALTGMAFEPPARAPRCEAGEYYLGRVSGALRDDDERPMRGVFVTVCATTCVAAETGADGRFQVDVDRCFGGSAEYAHGAAFGVEGLGLRPDLYVDLNPADLGALGAVRFTQPLYPGSFRRGGEARPGANPRAAVTLVDGLGFALRFVPATITFPINADEEVVRAVRVPVERLPPYAAAPPLVAYAISPAGAELSTPARVEFPNVTGLRPRTAVDIVAVGNHASYGRPAVGVLERVDVGYVSDDGLRILSANGLRFFGTVGYREVGR